MNKGILALWFFVLVFLQIMIFNNISLWGIVTPMVYIMFIFILPFNTPKWLVVGLGFLLGLSIDLFTGSLGQHAAATTLIAFLRMPVIRIIPTHIKLEEYLQPIFFDMGFSWFFLYALSLTVIHHLTFFFIDSLSFQNIVSVLLATLWNTLATLLIIFFLQIIFFKQSKRY